MGPGVAAGTGGPLPWLAGLCGGLYSGGLYSGGLDSGRDRVASGLYYQYLGSL